MAKKRPPKDDTPLGSGAFGALAALKGSLPKGEPAPDSPTKPSAPASPFSVKRTRKGGWPLSKERRSGGTWVTVISRVEGDDKALLKALRRHCGAGGAAKGDKVEIQGEHLESIAAFLDRQPF